MRPARDWLPESEGMRKALHWTESMWWRGILTVLSLISNLIAFFIMNSDFRTAKKASATASQATCATRMANASQRTATGAAETMIAIPILAA
jgi:hypothetical protein